MLRFVGEGILDHIYGLISSGLIPNKKIKNPMNTLTLFYTHNLKGDLTLLPRLQTFLQQLKRQYDTKPLLLDLGASCVPEAWHCAATGGRSMPIVLDGMGYHAANVAGMFAEDSRDKLKNLISMALVDEAHSWRYHVPPVRDDGILISTQPAPALRLCIVLSPAETTSLADNMLHLQGIQEGEVGVVTLVLADEPTLASHAIHPMPANTLADITIIAAIELVESEAKRIE